MKKMKKNRSLLILVLAFITIFSVSCKDDEVGLVAKVNGKGISEEEFEAEFNKVKDSYERQYGEDFIYQIVEGGISLEEKIRGELLDKFILNEIIVGEAEKKNIVVSQEEIKEVFEKTKEGLGGQEALDKYLLDNNLDVESLKESLAGPILIEKFEETSLSEINVSEEEIQSYYDGNKTDLIKVRARHILVKTEAEAEEILKELKAGKDFGDLAREKSIHYLSAKEGGDLGEFSKGDWIKDFEDEVFKLEEGELSPVIKTETGYHIVFLEDKKDDLDSLREDIIKKIKEEKYIKILEELKENAKIKKFDNGQKNS